MNSTRILVYGVTGSGKSTLASRISEKTGLPYVSVDDLTWEPGWLVVPFEHQKVIFTEICEREQWILDNAYGHWVEVPLKNVDLIIALDYPRWVSMGRLFRRTLDRLLDQKLICNGNRESLRGILSRDSILVWYFRSFRRKRARIKAWEQEGRRMLVFRQPQEAEKWLATLTNSS